MAVLAVAGAGALGASALGLGWQAGWLVGSVVGQALFAPGRSAAPDQEGPRLSDLAVSSSAYGAPIPIAYGTLRLAGNMIWSSGLKERVTTREVATGGGGGKGGGRRGGGSTTVTEYSYSASFALAFGEGPAEAVLRIWADGKLIFDRTGSAQGSGTVARAGVRVRFHPGTADQLPDPLIAAVQGAANTPAHRGLVVLVFEDLELADYGNRIPNITAEITWRAVPRYPVQPLQFGAGPLASFSRTELAVDWRRGQGFLSASSPAGLRRFNTRAMVEDRQVTQTDVLASTGGVSGSSFDCLFSGSDGALYCTAGSGNARPILRIDPDALREVARFGSYGVWTSNGNTRFGLTQRMAMITRGGAHHLLTANGIGPEHLGLLEAGSLRYAWHENSIGGTIAALTGGAEGEGWALTAESASLRLHRIAVGAARGDVRRSVDAAFAPWDIDTGATAFATGDAGGLNVDPTDGGLVFWCGVTGPGIPARQYVVKWRPGLGTVWRTSVPIWPDSFANDQPVTTARLTGDGFAMARTSSAGGGTWRVIRLDLRSGAITLDASGWVNGASSLSGAQVYDGLTDSLIAYDPAGRFARLALGRVGSDPRTLSGIVSDLCGRAGLEPGDVDVGDLASITVPGFVLSRQGSVRSAIEPLARAFFFDGVESDDRLAFRTRGRGPAASLDPALLIPLAGAGAGGGADTRETWRERRAQEVDLPARINIIHMDAGADYQQGAQAEQRAAPTMASRHQVSTELPIALGAGTARSIAARALYAAWTERSSFEALLPCDYLGLEPTDVVDLALPSGSTFRVRIEQVDLGADFTLSLRAVSQEPASYDITRVADGGQGRPVTSLDGAPETRLILPDLPLLRDIDAPAGALSRLHAFMGGYGSGPWTGAALFRSADRVNWGFVARSRTEIAHGVTQAPLGAPRAVFATDEENTLRVAMTTGGDRLESVTQAALLDGANAALLTRAGGLDGGDGTDGADGSAVDTPEVIQFREVEPLGDETYLLRGLLRGRRGTDVFAGDHPAGVAFILLEPDTIATSLLPLGDLGQPRHWRAVGFGERFEDAPILTRVHTGRDLMPYAPVHLRAETVADGVEINWVRRTRLGGDLRDGTGTVPLAETVERYELDILDGPGGAVLRTLTSDTPSALYAADQIAADFGTVPAQLSVILCQISEAVGRGLPRTTTLEITP